MRLIYQTVLEPELSSNKNINKSVLDFESYTIVELCQFIVLALFFLVMTMILLKYGTEALGLWQGEGDSGQVATCKDMKASPFFLVLRGMGALFGPNEAQNSLDETNFQDFKGLS